MQQGAEQTARQIALDLLNSGVDVNVVTKITKLDIELLNKLQESAKH